MQYIIRSYQIQNNHCSGELKHSNRDKPSPTTNDTLTCFEETTDLLLSFDVEFFNNHLTQMPLILVIIT